MLKMEKEMGIRRLASSHSDVCLSFQESATELLSLYMTEAQDDLSHDSINSLKLVSMNSGYSN